MIAALALAATVVTVVGIAMAKVRRDRSRAAAEVDPDAPHGTEAAAEVDPDAPGSGVSAGSPSAGCADSAKPNPAAEPDSPPPRETGPPAAETGSPSPSQTGPPADAVQAKVLCGPSPDGSTHFRCHAPEGGWSSTIDELRLRARQGQATATLPDREGEIEVAVEFVKGELHLSRREWDLYVRGHKARLELRAQAIGTETLASWYAREFPRVTRWLFGVQLERQPLRSLIGQLDAIGWRTSMLELAVDLVGFPIALACIEAVITRIRRGREDGELGTTIKTGLSIGSRSSSPLSGVIYDKLAELGRHKGHQRAVWEANARARGWLGEAVTRVEFRFRNEALLLGHDADGEPEVDGSHVGAPLDPEVCTRLWAYACAQVRLVDVAEGMRRGIEHPKNYPDLPQWLVVAAAAGKHAGERLIRIAAVAELEALTKVADEDLRRGAVRRAVLDGATTLDVVRSEAAHHLERVLAMPEVAVDLRRSVARYGELLDQARGAELAEQSNASDVVSEDRCNRMQQ